MTDLRAIEFSTKNQREKRVEDLWRRLDPQGDRELDLKGLKKGLRRIDHRESSLQPTRVTKRYPGQQLSTGQP